MDVGGALQIGAQERSQPVREVPFGHPFTTTKLHIEPAIDIAVQLPRQASSGQIRVGGKGQAGAGQNGRVFPRSAGVRPTTGSA